MARGNILPLAWTVAAFLGVAGVSGTHGQALDAETIKALRAEHKRRGDLSEWASKKKIVPQEYQRIEMAPVVEGNQEDIERNLSFAEKCLEQAKDAERNRQPETMQKYQRAANQFRKLAQLNRDILIALRDGRNDEMVKACQTLMETENEIHALTGRRVRRKWFTPQEMMIPLPKEDATGDPAQPAPREAKPSVKPPSQKPEAPAAK